MKDPYKNYSKKYLNIVKSMCENIFKVRDIKECLNNNSGEDIFAQSEVTEMNLGNGTARINMKPKDGIFYKILSELCDTEIASESHLIDLVKDLHHAKVEYDKVSIALQDVKDTGYGLVAPQLSEMKFEEPEIVKHGSKYGIKLKASAPSLHLIKADIETEISPIMGTEKETEELMKSLLNQFENDPSKLWQSNMFGKSLEVLVKEGLQNKLYKMPEDVQVKIQKTLQKIINEGNGGLICIIL